MKYRANERDAEATSNNATRAAMPTFTSPGNLGDDELFARALASWPMSWRVTATKASMTSTTEEDAARQRAGYTTTMHKIFVVWTQIEDYIRF